MAKKPFGDEVDVLKYQREIINKINKDCTEMNEDLDEVEEKIQNFLKSQNINADKIVDFIENNEIEKSNSEQQKSIPQKNFNDLINEVNESGCENVDIYELATIEEIKELNFLLNKYYSEFTDKYKLDKYDYAVAGIIGTLGALLDFFAVTNIEGKIVKPGKLKSGVEALWNNLLSGYSIKELEEKYKVSYDISLNSSKISQEVLGLSPSYHRFQSLGHDPILGFIFGVSDLMKGQLTAIDGNGRLIIQSVKGAEIRSFIESVITVFGHLLSDVGTKSKSGKVLSVPAPLTPLLQLINTGSIEYNDQKFTISDLSKKLYSDGYNFNHFIGMSIPVMLIEVLMRLYFVVKETFFSKENTYIKDNPKLTIMLTIANGILFTENMGKFIITNNPFAINYISWISTALYGFKTLKWISYDIEIGKIKQAQQYIDNDWQYLMMSANKLDSNDPVYFIDKKNQ